MIIINKGPTDWVMNIHLEPLTGLWILSTSFWNDSGTWDDVELWLD